MRGPERLGSRLLEALLGLGLLAGLARLWRPARPRLTGVDLEDLRAGHELSDMWTAAVVAFAISLLTALALALIAVTAFMFWRAGPPVVLAPAGVLEPQPAGGPTAEPRLETAPGQTLAALKPIEQERLNTYAWINRSAGTVRIPIDRAIDLLVERGLPSAPPAANQPPDQGRSRPSDASSGRVEERVWP